MGTDFYEQWSELYRNAKTNDQRWELIDFKDAFLQYTDGTLIQDISDFIMDHPAYAIGAGVGGAVMIGVIVGTGGTAAITGAPFVSAGAWN